MPEPNDTSTTHPGERLKQLRLARDLTQEGLAERAALSLGVVKKLERGGTARLDTYHALARALEVRTSALFEPGGPHSTTRDDNDNIDMMPLRQAIAPAVTFSGDISTPDLIPTEPDLARLETTSREVALAYHRDDYEHVAQLLPALVHAAHACVHHFDNGLEHVRAVRVRSDVGSIMI